MAELMNFDIIVDDTKGVQGRLEDFCIYYESQSFLYNGNSSDNNSF